MLGILICGAPSTVIFEICGNELGIGLHKQADKSLGETVDKLIELQPIVLTEEQRDILFEVICSKNLTISHVEK